MLRRAPLLLVSSTFVFIVSPAWAQTFAEPLVPDPYPGEHTGDYRDRHAPAMATDPVPSSTVRVHTGPSLRVNEDSPNGGLFAALDVGEKAAGLRASGTWVRVGSDGGMSQYAAELWIDFGHNRRLHPILGAGAGVARLDRVSGSGSGEIESRSVGIGVLRGALQYVLPVNDTDARAGIEVLGAVPAIAAEDAGDPRPWLLITATVGVGF